MGIDLGAHFIGRTLAGIRIGRAALGCPQRILIDVFVVHDQQEVAGGRVVAQGEVVHAIVMHADGVELDLRRHRQILAPLGCLGIERRAPRRQHLCGIPLGNHDCIRA